MKLMEEAMSCRSKNNSNACKKREAAEQRVAPGENFARIALQRRYRPHAGQNHRRVDKGVHPRHSFKGAVANHANTERDCDDQESHSRAPRHALVKLPAWQQWF